MATDTALQGSPMDVGVKSILTGLGTPMVMLDGWWDALPRAVAGLLECHCRALRATGAAPLTPHPHSQAQARAPAGREPDRVAESGPRRATPPARLGSRAARPSRTDFCHFRWRFRLSCWVDMLQPNFWGLRLRMSASL